MPGDKWMIRGPKEYVPPVEVTVEKLRVSIPLDENEGIYVRNIKNGKVRFSSKLESYLYLNCLFELIFMHISKYPPFIVLH